MRPLETKAETDHRLWVEGLGYQSWKLNPLGRVGIPDRLIILPHRHIFFIEFKREGETARKIQKYIHNILRELGHHVYVCESLEEAKTVTYQELKEARRRIL